MPTIDAAVGGSAANSFVTAERALEILDTLPWQGEWPQAVAASATLGAGDNGTVTVAVDVAGAAGNDYTAEAVAGVGNSVPLSAALTVDALVVTLGTTALGALDPAKNTAGLVAAAISALADFTATAGGTGATAVGVNAVRAFTGGDDRDDAIARLLIQATRWIRVKTCWTGSPATATQALPWPRSGMLDGNGNAIAEDVIPEDMEVAEVTLAVLLAKSDVTAGNEVAEQGLTKIKAGPVELNFKDDIAVAALPSPVSALFVPSWLCPVTADAPFMFAIT